MWEISDITPGEEYVIILCQDSEGRRTFHLRQKGDAGLPHAVLVTHVVSHDLLKTRDIYHIARSSYLEDGGEYDFDTHGIWFTREEMEALEEELEVPWVTEMPPLVAPK